MAKATLARMEKIDKELKAAAAEKAKPAEAPHLTVNPERGERGGFLKVTITLPTDLLIALRTEGTKRRGEGQQNTSVSELIREFCAAMLTQKS